MGLLVSSTACVVSLSICELAARHLDPLWSMRDVNPCRMLRPELGGGFRANCSCRWERRLRDGRKVFDIRFETDAGGHRVTPQTSDRSRQLAVFVGCSFTLGAGVQQAETMPARFASLTGWRVLNLGGSGFGPQQALVELRRLNQPADLVVYTLIPGHVARASGSWQVIGTFGAFFPSYRDGGVPFAVAHPWRLWWARLAARSALIRRLPEDRSDIELTAEILEQCAHATFPARFVVVAWPGPWQKSRLLERLAAHVVEVWEPEMNPANQQRLLDGHPAPAAYEQVATWLAEKT
jgi:hypothetical protein